MVNIRPISQELQMLAIRELHERPEEVQDDLDTIRKWLKKSPHIRAREDDQFLISFLRGCKYRIEKVKEKIDLFYSVRSVVPEVMKNRDPLNFNVRKVIKEGVGLPLPKTMSPTDPKIMLIRACKFDLSLFTFLDVIKVGNMISDILMRDDDEMVICGQILIVDLANVTAKHLFSFNFSQLKKAALLNQDASPLRQKGFHFINPPPMFDSILNTFKTFMSEKNRQKALVCHGHNMESLYEYFPKDVLPEEYGGHIGPIQGVIDYWEQKLIENRDYIIEDENLGVNLKLKPVEHLFTEEKLLFGIEGSFRKLEID